MKNYAFIHILTTCAFVISTLLLGCMSKTAESSSNKSLNDAGKSQKNSTAQQNVPGIDTAAFNKLQQHITNGDTTGLWPVKQPYPTAGAVLPYNRIVAYYGNLFSKRMGILGELPKEAMLKKLMVEVKKWEAADTLLPVVPALHYVAVTAQSEPGKTGKYRMRMPFHQVDTIINWAKEINALAFVDVQVGTGSLQEEIPEFEKYLLQPNVHLGIDPEFSMKTGARPGTVIGTFDAADINYVSDYLAGIVKKYNLPPKILVVHRFTGPMVTNYKNIKLRPEVQIVMDMDGWGIPSKKANTYYQFIHPQPVQFTGFKIFYKNDTQRVGEKREMQPEDVLRLRPAPVYIQYQ